MPGAADVMCDAWMSVVSAADWGYNAVAVSD